MKASIILIFFLVFLGCSQKPKDNDNNTISDSTVDSIQEWLAIAKKGKELPLEDRKYYLDQAQIAANGIKNDTIRINQLSNISLTYKSIKDSLNFRKTNANVLKLAEEANLFEVLGNTHWDLAHFLESYTALDSAFYHYRKALNSFERTTTNETLKSKGIMLYNMARIQDSYRDYLGAETSVTAALKIFDELGDEERIHNCYNVLGVIANGMGDRSNALQFYEMAGDYLERLDSPKKQKLLWTNKNNIASLYMNMEEYSKAEEYYSKLIHDKEFKAEDPKLYIKAISSLAYTKLKNNGDHTEVENLLNEAKSLSDVDEDPSNLARLQQFYAELYAAKGDSVKAKEKATESLNIAKASFNNDRSLEVLKLLGIIDSENANDYFYQYSKLNETIQDEQRTKRNKFARISWETDQIIEENQVLTEEKQMWAGAVFGLVVFGFAFISIVILYINNNRLKFKQKQQESNQEIYNLMLSQQGKFEEGKQLEQKRISEELHDGILGEMLGIRLILSGLNEREDPASVEQRAGLIEKLRGVEEEIRTISHELNSAAYKKFHNFIVSLEDMIGDIEQSSGITCSFTYDNEVSWDNLLGDIKINAYRIVQEALKNCIKHAESQRVTINFQPVGDNLQLTITDDGIGFDVNKGRKGIGLKNIISRTKKIKGTVDIDSQKGVGTTITVTLPARYIELNLMEQTQTANA